MTYRLVEPLLLLSLTALLNLVLLTDGTTMPLSNGRVKATDGQHRRARVPDELIEARTLRLDLSAREVRALAGTPTWTAADAGSETLWYECSTVTLVHNKLVAWGQSPAGKSLPLDTRSVLRSIPSEYDVTYRGGDLAEPNGSLGAFRLGQFSYSITSCVVGPKFGDRTASKGAVYALVNFLIRNESHRTQEVVSDDFELLDTFGNTYTNSKEANSVLRAEGIKQDYGTKQLQPGLTKELETGFEVQEASLKGGMKLIVPEKGSGTGRVVIPLKF